MAKKNGQGYVYILTNPSFREDWVKIGKSSRPVDTRSKELDNTAVPLPFEIFATLKTAKYEKAEKQIHEAIDRMTNWRIRKSREFFNIEPQNALAILRNAAMTIDDAEIKVYANGNMSDNGEKKPPESKSRVNPKVNPQGRRTNFQFSMINIGIGETIVFIPRGIKVKVASDNEVKYKGYLYTLTSFARQFLPKSQRTASEQYCGPQYFEYDGRNLVKIRRELEQNDNNGDE